MAAPILMHTETQILTLAQWLSPAFPIGSFAYSHGLEGAVDQGWVKDGPDLEAWLTDVLECGAGRADVLLMAAAHNAKTLDLLGEIDQVARAISASKERLKEADAQGKAFGKAVAVWDVALEDLTYPVALGAASAHHGLPLELTQKLYLQAFLSNLLAAGQRLLPIGQKQVLAILRRLSVNCVRIASETSDGDLDKLSSHALMTDIAAMKHETQYSRIFRT